METDSFRGQVNPGTPIKYAHEFSKLNYSFIQSFGHFYSAPSSPLLLREAPDYSTDTVSEFPAEGRGLFKQVHGGACCNQPRLKCCNQPTSSG